MNKNATKKKQVTLETIEKRLERQDIESRKFIRFSMWFVPINFAFAMVLSGIVVWVTTGNYGILIVGLVYLGFGYFMYRRSPKGISI